MVRRLEYIMYMTRLIQKVTAVCGNTNS